MQLGEGQYFFLCLQIFLGGHGLVLIVVSLWFIFNLFMVYVIY